MLLKSVRRCSKCFTGGNPGVHSYTAHAFCIGRRKLDRPTVRYFWIIQQRGRWKSHILELHSCSVATTGVRMYTTIARPSLGLFRYSANWMTHAHHTLRRGLSGLLVLSCHQTSLVPAKPDLVTKRLPILTFRSKLALALKIQICLAKARQFYLHTVKILYHHMER